MTIWLHPWTERKVDRPTSGHLDLRQNCQSFQLVKSLYSIGQGGFGGTGLGKGTVTNLNGKPIIPDQSTDFIFSTLAQEIGLVGAAAVLLVYMIFGVAGDADRVARAGWFLEAARGRADLRFCPCRRSSSSAASCG